MASQDKSRLQIELSNVQRQNENIQKLLSQKTSEMATEKSQMNLNVVNKTKEIDSLKLELAKSTDELTQLLSAYDGTKLTMSKNSQE